MTRGSFWQRKYIIHFCFFGVDALIVALVCVAFETMLDLLRITKLHNILRYLCVFALVFHLYHVQQSPKTASTRTTYRATLVRTL